ncbi:MAG: tRNA lysidine(34) synthetase TilS [Vicinamibacterales bacterium]
MSLIDDVRRTVRLHNLATSTTRVAVALSGGPDSTALLCALRELHAAGDLQLAGVVHLNHQLRPDAEADEAHCARLAARLDLPFVSERADVRATARREHRSIEDAAHHVRHAFFIRAAAALGADVVALGHTMDDQAETVLLRLLRGAGTRGLAAMRPKRGVVIRPLLATSREAVHAFLRERGIDALQDASNDDRSIPRNRVRAELLPLLTSRFNPRIVQTLALEADLAREDEAYFAPLVDAWVAEHVRRPKDGVVQLERAALASVPTAVAWRVLHLLMREAAGRRPVSKIHVALAWDVVAGQAPAWDGPHHRLERVGADVVLTTRPAGTTGRPHRTTGPRVPAFCRNLPVPGEVTLPETGHVLSAEVAELDGHPPEANRWTAVVPKDRVAAGVVVRNRRAGDRLRVSDAGHRKLQDLLVDRKVPREMRDQVPIVTDQTGRIVWVAGVAQDRDFQVKDPVQAVVILRLKAVGGSS